MNELAQEKCKYCGRDLSNLEIYEVCPCRNEEIKFRTAEDDFPKYSHPDD